MINQIVTLDMHEIPSNGSLRKNSLIDKDFKKNLLCIIYSFELKKFSAKHPKKGISLSLSLSSNLTN